MFEPIGGSAPKYTGKNMINPLAAIIAVQMMLSHIGEEKGALLIETSVLKVIHHHMKSMEAGKMGIGTREIGDRVASFIRESA
jgi:3-isopropylmalate dehydrogenase